MKYSDFENAISSERLSRYLVACGNDTRKAMTLYRYNLKVSQEMFTIVSCFEVAFRNRVNSRMVADFGVDWLRDSIGNNGIFSLPILRKTAEIIRNANNKLLRQSLYSHSKLLAEMEFGVWKYMFSPVQYRQAGSCLLKIFPNKPKSDANHQYNRSYVFNELDKINSLRNRIAHHEPICFVAHSAVIDTDYIRTIYRKILNLFYWMGIDAGALLYGVDHVEACCRTIDNLKDS